MKDQLRQLWNDYGQPALVFGLVLVGLAMYLFGSNHLE